jgi:hypothetical protein
MNASTAFTSETDNPLESTESRRRDRRGAAWSGVIA